ncbi:MAG: MBL fold metallo-hydrolase [Ignavibacteriae bacterium]|nr:MAG: MBL fold metallo-hydrolase [Ignavibacteriota bacterium]
MITITPFGAAGEVTGSAYMVETDEATILVDFGMFQGDKDDDAKNVVPGRVHRASIDALVLTHGHLDHCGRIPMLVRDGWRGPIYATSATRDLASIILYDSAHIQESDYERRKRKALSKNRKTSRVDEPLYDSDDVDHAMELFVDVEYLTEFQVAKGITAFYYDAGHMLGSASVELRIKDGDNVRTVVFSGDIGPPDLPFLKDPEAPAHADAVFLESTYGDRNHKSMDETIEQFESILQEAISTKGKIFIPAFAIGRAQNMMFHIAELMREGSIPPIDVYLDSPMAIAATNTYSKHRELFDPESTALVESGQFRHEMHEYLHFSQTSDDSKALNDLTGPYIVIAGAGMCNAGRIVHHLRYNINNPNAHIIIVGYQARGSLGRRLVDGAEYVTILGESKAVRANIHTLGGFSAHAGQTDLIEWFRMLGLHKPKLFLTHGEDYARVELKRLLDEQYGVNAYLPVYGEPLGV